jgi:hypothetical protein
MGDWVKCYFSNPSWRLIHHEEYEPARLALLAWRAWAARRLMQNILNLSLRGLRELRGKNLKLIDTDAVRNKISKVS